MQLEWWGFISLGDAADALNAACYTIEGKPDDAYISVLAIGVDSAVGLRYAKDLGETIEKTETKIAKEANNISDGSKAEKTVERTSEADFVGMLKGKPVTLPNVKVHTIQYTKRNADELTKIRNVFNTTERKKFLKELVTDDAKLTQLRKAGLSDLDIQKLSDGFVPTGYQVHHKIPLDGGGTNDFSNLVLIKNDLYHKVIKNAQKSLTSGLEAGKTVKLDDWPILEGFIYPATK